MAWVEQCGNRSWRVRYRRDDGTIGAIRGFATKTAATEHANTLEADQREGRFLDPAAGKITLAEWSQDWLAALDVAIRTEDVYRSLLRRHILPRWGDHGLVDISGIKAAAWAKELRAAGYSAVTVAAVLKLLSLLLADATEERLIAANPIRARRRGRRRTERRTERRLGHPRRGARDRRQRRPPPQRRPGGGGPDRHRGLDRGPVGRDRRAATPQPPPRRRRLPGHRPARRGGDRVQPRDRARPAQDRRVRPHHHPAPVPDRSAARPPGLARASVRVRHPDRRTAPQQQLRSPRAAPGRGRHPRSPAGDGAAGAGQARADLPRAPARPQDLDDRRRRPRSRASPTARATSWATGSRRPTPTSPPKSRTDCSPGCKTGGTKPSPTAHTNPRGGKP